MAVEETSLGVPGASEPGAGLAGDSPSPSQSPAAPSEQSSGNVQSQPDPSQQTAAPTDPLEGIPSLEELQGKDNVPYAKAVAQLRGAYEPLSAQHKELTTKFAPFESVADRFQTPEEVQSVVKLHDSLNKYSPGPDGQLIPDPSEFVQEIVTNDPDRADILNGHLLWSQVKIGRDQRTGQPILAPRAEAFLQMVASDPDMKEFRGRALQILGGVEPSQVPAPTWTPTQEELDKVDPSLIDTYKKLSYEERDELKLGSPEYINSQLRTRQLNEQLMSEKTDRENRDRQAYEQQQQRVEQEAKSAGDQYVETGFREGFTNFAKHIYETYKPTDNDVVNRTEGAQVALAVVALSHPDTRFAAEQALKDMGVDPADLEAFNKARETYAQNGRQHGYLTHKKMRTNGDPSRDQQRLIALAKGLATKITKAKDAGFVLRAKAHNDTLDQATTARPVIGGQPPGSGRIAAASGARHPWQDI